jgi:hypothetical protein
VRRTVPLASLLAWLSLQAAIPATAQQIDSTATRTSPLLVKYGKWATLAAAVGMGIEAATAHHAADQAFSRLSRYCDSDSSRCTQGSNGAYLDPVAEGYYQASLRQDGRARRWLVGGEVALLGTASLFVWELTRPKRTPRNIPFEPSLEFSPGTTRLGLRAAF